MISAAGQVSTVAGRAGSKGHADGAGAAAQFNSPVGVCMSVDGTFALVADTNNLSSYE